jgi:hypothetical protein
MKDALDPTALFDIFNTAIEEERKAQERYRRGAQLAGTTRSWRRCSCSSPRRNEPTK